MSQDATLPRWNLADGGERWRSDPDGSNPSLECLRAAADGTEIPIGAEVDVAAICATRIALSGPCERRCHVFPAEFNFCPSCRSQLGPTPQPKEPLWVAPHGLAGSGRRAPGALRTVAATGHPDVMVSPIGGGTLEFFVVNNRRSVPRLVATDRRGRAVHLWNRRTSRWSPLAAAIGGSHAASSLAAWQWSAESIGGCLVVPTDRGIMRVTIDDVAMGFHAAGGDARCLGGVAADGNHALAPVQDAQGALGIEVLDVGTGSVLMQPVLGAPAADGMDFSTPFVDRARRRVFWIASQGVLQLDLEQRSAHFRAASAGTQFAPGYGPPYLAADGVVWQLGYGDEDTFMEEVLTPDTSARSARRQSVGRMIFGTGRTMAAGADLWLARPPWYEPSVRGGDDRDAPLVWPLLEWDDQVLLLQIPEDPGASQVFEDERPHFVEFVLSSASSTARLWEDTMTKPWDTRWFVHDGALHMYHPMRNDILRWRLS